MHAKTVKKSCTFARSRAINKLFHIRWYLWRFIARYWAIYLPIFQILAVFCCKWYGRTMSPYCIDSKKKTRYRPISLPTRPIFKTGLKYILMMNGQIWASNILWHRPLFILSNKLCFFFPEEKNGACWSIFL